MIHASKKIVSFDTETQLFIKGNQTPRIVCASTANRRGETQLVQGADAACELLRSFLRDPNAIICGAFIAFDFATCAHHDPSLLPLIFEALDQGRVWDVLIGATLTQIAIDSLHTALRDPASGKVKDRFSLAIVTKMFLGKSDAKANDFWRLRYAILESVPLEKWPAEAREYPLDDARNTLDVALAQMGLPCAFARDENDNPQYSPITEGDPRQNNANHAAQARADFALYLSAVWGQKVDGAALSGLESKFQKLVSEARAEYTKHGFFRADGTKDTKAIHAAVQAAYGGNAPTTETGKVSASRDTLSESGDPLLEGFGEVSKYEKILSSYLPFLRQGVEVPITGRPNVLVASGRVSYEGLDQTMPRGSGLRDCFVPRSGNVLSSSDYSALELRTLAQCQIWICGRSTLADALNADLDPHCDFAASMLGVSYDGFMRVFRDKEHADHKFYKAMRQASKAANFGFPGGMGALKLTFAQRKVGIRFCETMERDNAPCGTEKIRSWRGADCAPVCKRCVELATQLREQWRQKWPEMDPYFFFVKHHAESGTIRQFVSGRVRGDVGFSDAANTLFQGLAADGAKAALWAVQRACYDETRESILLNRARVFLFAHDEILAEHEEGSAHLTAPEIARIMVEEMRKFTPDVTQKVEPALMRRWLKEAEPAFDSAGKLIPWEPKGA